MSMRYEAFRMLYAPDGRAELQFTLAKGESIDTMPDSGSISVKKAKRSLDANAYAWVLIGEIASVLRANKEDVYITMLSRYGQLAVDDKGDAVIFSVRADIDFKSYYKYCFEIGESEAGGNLFTHYRVVRGSSTYDSKEMAVFIDGVISEAKELGIETLPPDEVVRLKGVDYGKTTK